MNKPNLPPRIPFWAFGLVILTISLATTGYWLSSLWHTREELIAEKLETFDRLRSIAAYKDNLRELNAAKADKVYEGLFLRSGTGAIVSADLLSQLKQMAAVRGVEVMRAGDLPAIVEGEITLVGGSLQMSGTTSNVMGFIQQIETARPLLFIDRINVRSGGIGGGEEKSDTILTVEMHVYGAVRSSQHAFSDKVN